MKMIDELGNFINDVEALNYKFLKFQDDKMVMRKVSQEELDKKKLSELTNWFDNYFDKQLTQSQWQKNFKVSEDPYFKDEKGQPRNYADIEELKAQAEIVRNEIRELRK